MHYIPKFVRPVGLALALVSILAACYNDEAPATPSSDIQINKTVLGDVLTDQSGRTLYFFPADANGKSACSGTCLNNWPAFYKETPTLSTSLTAGDFTTITRDDGTRQTTFRGWPLYTYKNDTRAGDVLGDNAGGSWYVARTDYSIMIGSGQLVGHDGTSYTKDYKEGTGNTLYLTDGTGKTLYAFVNDRRGKNNYTRADFSNNATWPLFEDALKSIPSVPKASDFGIATTLAPGHTQISYKGWPLYYFGPDLGVRGNTKGVSSPKPGVWPILYTDTPEAPL